MERNRKSELKKAESMIILSMVFIILSFVTQFLFNQTLDIFSIIAIVLLIVAGSGVAHVRE